MTDFEEKKQSLVTEIEEDSIEGTFENLTSLQDKNSADIIEVELSGNASDNTVNVFSSSYVPERHEIQLDFILDRYPLLTIDEALDIVKKAEEYHEDDFNFPIPTMEKLHMLVKGPEQSGLTLEEYEIELCLEAVLMKFHSPYPEVRAVTNPVDDPSEYVETIRAYIIGLFWSGVGSMVAEMFQARQPALTLKSTVLQLLVYPCGMAAAKILPDLGITIRGTRHSLNPGPWTYKEQMFATIMTNTGGRFSNLINYVFLFGLPVFYDQTWVGFGFMILLNISTEYFGFGMAGILRRWVVYSPKAVWPTMLPTLALNKTLLLPEEKTAIHGWTMTRYKFLLIFMIGSFVYYFLPDFLFQALSTFNWMTWIAPQNKNLAFITGSILGLGFNPISTFDWAVINNQQPLVTPFYATLNYYLGAVGGALLILALYYTNYKSTAYLPINSANTFDNEASKYNVSRVSQNNKLDIDAYKNYSPPYLSAGNLVRQGAAFAQYTLSFVFVGLTDWRLLKSTFYGMYRSIRYRNSSGYNDFDDPITRMMTAYPEVPDWWYYCILLISLVMGIIAFQLYPLGIGVWIIFVVFAISMALLVPSAIVYAVSGYQLVMNDFMALVGGYLAPGSGMGVLMCRFYGWNTDTQAETFVSDLKLGHYAKLPPRAVFRGQMVATFLHVFVTIGGIYTVLDVIPDLCTTGQVDRYTCPVENGMFTSVTLFGTIGPDRIFNTLYPGLSYCFLVGALVAILFYFLRRYFPDKCRYIHPVVIMSGVASWGQTYNLSYYTPGMIISYFFMYLMKRRYLAWWTKYNYVLTSALTAGTAFSAILIFGAINYTRTTVNWWGNTVYKAGVDGTTAARLTLNEGEYFGIRRGTFS
ncbi:OPT oligopeptide transporter protein-domain-containing protein [Lipomyces oligophaga]|uniref:OPT oligopeptide transporter protein-domain-containing protein n=1 Tax=Lipomyces oligophaga TaxID=45792 RepID=UPI0034CDFE92